jgi:Aconitase A
MSLDSFAARGSLHADGTPYLLHRLDALPDSQRLPYSLKVLLENLLRNEDGRTVTADQIAALAGWDPASEPATEVQFTPTRVLMQDFTGVPCIVDLVAMREAMAALGGDPALIDARRPVELVIDHSVIADHFGSPAVFSRNVELEYRRNRERYQFLRWGQTALRNLRVVPPGTGICHQVNLEHLARVVFAEEMTCPVSTPSPRASTATVTPSSPASPCPGAPESWKGTSTASFCGIRIVKLAVLYPGGRRGSAGGWRQPGRRAVGVLVRPGWGCRRVCRGGGRVRSGRR